MKKNAIPVSAITTLSPRLLRADGRTCRGPLGIELYNLRPAAGSSGEHDDYVAAGEPMCNSALAGWRPLGRVAASDGTPRTVMCKGPQVCVVADPSSATTEPLAATLPGEAHCAAPAPDGSLLVMTDAGCTAVTADPDLRDAVRDYPPVTLIAESASPVQASVGPRTLSQTYPGDSRLSDTDNRRIVDDYVDAYRRLTAAAASTGAFIQPVLARYRLLGADGRVLFTSAPVYLSHPDGSPCSGSHALGSADGRVVNGYTLTAPTWKLRLHTDPSAADMGVAAVEVMMSPQFHPYRPSARAYATVGRLSSGQTWAHVSLPGRSAGVGSEFGDTDRRNVGDAIARLDAIERRTAVVNAPFRSTGLSAIVACRPEPDLDAEASRLTAAMAAPAPRCTLNDVLLRPPHTFTARHGCRGGAVTAWADITVHRYQGYPVGSLAASLTPSASGNALTVVKFADKSGTMRSESLAGSAPATFGPVLCYPSADATELTISVSTGGVTRRRVFPLTADASGRYALYIEPGLKPIELPVSPAGAIVDVAGSAVRFPGTVAFADSANPLHLCASTITGSGPVGALLLRKPSEASWEFGRERFVAATGSRIFSLGISSATWRPSLKVILPSGIRRPDAIVNAGADIYAVSSSALVCLGPDSSARHVARAPDTAALAYDATRGELWLIDGSGSARCFLTGRSPYYFRRSCPAVGTVATDGTVSYGVTASGLVLFGHEVKPSTVQVEFTTVAAGSALQAVQPRRLRVAATATGAAGTIELTSADASGTPLRSICTLSIDGRAAAPLVVPLVTAPVRTQRLAMRCHVSNDFRITSATTEQ